VTGSGPTDLRELMTRGPVVGTFVKLARPEVIAVLAQAGFDFVICDLEHSQLDERDCREAILAARTEGLPVIVRVAQPDRGLINRLLEVGAAGIQLPRTRHTADSVALRDLMSYPPSGSRSVSQAQPAARYGAIPLADYLARSNETVLAIGQFETADLADPLDEVVKPLDVAFIGSLDLSVDAGAPGRADAPAVRRLVAMVESAAARTGTHLGVFAATADAAASAVAAGYRYIAVGADITMLAGAARSLVAAARGGS
jgi:2-keto-3-deoxy-L-rhamnonate aldolase RhmA